jgi:hypothetical protein
LVTTTIERQKILSNPPIIKKRLVAEKEIAE